MIPRIVTPALTHRRIATRRTFPIRPHAPGSGLARSMGPSGGRRRRGRWGRRRWRQAALLVAFRLSPPPDEDRGGPQEDREDDPERHTVVDPRIRLRRPPASATGLSSNLHARGDRP